MPTICDKLDEILAIKAGIHTAIEGKGVDVPPGTPFEDYPGKIDDIVIPDPPDPAVFCPAEGYILPSACPIPTLFNPPMLPVEIPVPAAGEILLYRYNLANRKLALTCTVSGGGQYHVEVQADDGTFVASSIKDSGVQYTATIGTDIMHRGQDVALNIIRITPWTEGATITGFALTDWGAYTPADYYIYFARFNAPGLLSLASAFEDCNTVQSIIFDSDLDSLTTLYKAFKNATALQAVTFPSMASLTTLEEAFYGDTHLVQVIFPAAMVSLENLKSTFYGCSILGTIVYPSALPALLSLETVHFGNSSIASILLPATMANVTTMLSAFEGCHALEKLILPVTMNALTTLERAFYDCWFMLTCTPPTSMTGLTSLSRTWFNCYRLTALTLPAALNAVTTALSMCESCYQLVTITTLTMQANTTYERSFYKCYKLTQVIISGTAAAVTSLLEMCYRCEAMTTFTLPASMNAVTTAKSMCYWCLLLTAVTLPTSMSGCTTLEKAFLYAESLEECTLPVTMSVLESLVDCFNFASSLATLVLPTALPALTDMSFMAPMDALTSLSACTFSTNIVRCDQPVSGRYLAAFDFPTLRTNYLLILGSAPASASAMTHVDVNWAVMDTEVVAITFGYLHLSGAEIDRIFGLLPYQEWGSGIGVTDCYGAPDCNPWIAEENGWYVGI